jgi:hypothetical protein
MNEAFIILGKLVNCVDLKNLKKYSLFFFFSMTVCRIYSNKNSSNKGCLARWYISIPKMAICVHYGGP